MKGIIIAVPSKYEKICLSNIYNIREGNSELAIEIWEAGKEISASTRSALSGIENLTFRNVNDHTDNVRHWKGFQIKAFILYHTSFSEVMLCDSDVIIHQDPEILFKDENYLRTGTYFFRDLEKWQFSKLTDRREQLRQKIFYNKFSSASFFLKRKKWLTGLLPEKSPLFPEEWDYMYQEEIPAEPVKEALQESGIVLIDKEKHSDTVRIIYELNDNHKDTYKYIWGDKETFWIACVMANKAYFFNPGSGYISGKSGKLTHDYKGDIFFSQKG